MELRSIWPDSQAKGNFICLKGKMLLLVTMMLLLYVYVLDTAMTIYLKAKMLDKVSVMIMENEKMIRQLYIMDQNFANDLERLKKLYGDY